MKHIYHILIFFSQNNYYEIKRKIYIAKILCMKVELLKFTLFLGISNNSGSY